MLELIEIIGMKRVGNEKRNRKYCLVKCGYCGSVVEMRYDTYRVSKSCGCLRAVKASKTALTLRTHQMTGTRIHNIWSRMKGRCYNPNDKRYDRYGGRGIEVDDVWKDDFLAFYEWSQASGYEDGLTIDRIDNDGDYSPDNCRWATSRMQSRNRSSNITVDYQGKKLTLIELSEVTNLPYGTLARRYDYGDRGSLLTRPLNSPTGRKEGSNNNKAKINEEIALEIKRLLAEGCTAVSIADKFKINKHIVYDINRGRTWNHVKLDNTEVTDRPSAP